LKHAIVYLGTARLRNFLITFLINNLATVDEKLYDLALRLSAVSMLMEKKASPHYSEDESFMAGIIYELAKLAKVSPLEVYDLFSPPEKYRKILKDQKLKLIYNSITESEKERIRKQLKEIFDFL
jgi:c-di-GMP-related signal transduction protein